MVFRHINYVYGICEEKLKLRCQQNGSCEEKKQSDLKGISIFPTHKLHGIDCEFPLTALS